MKTAHIIPDELLDRWILESLENWAPWEDVGYIYLWRAVTGIKEHQEQGSLSVSVQRITKRYEALIQSGRIFKTSRGHVIGPSEKKRRDDRAMAYRLRIEMMKHVNQERGSVQ